MNAGGRRFDFRVPEDQAGLRLDQALARSVPGLSRGKARLALELGAVFVDRQRVKVAGRIVRTGQQIVIHLGGALERAQSRLGREAREEDESRLPPYSVLFEDDALIAVDKPAGLLTAPTPESDRNNLASLLERRGGGRRAVWVVHRLDLQTSGVLVFAKTEAANRTLSETFRRHDLVRRYVALAQGVPRESEFTVDSPVGGKAARTRFRVQRAHVAFSELEAELETGRTHQIRLHLREVGHPVLADPKYAARLPWHPARLALHAALLELPHPVTGAKLRLESPLASDMRAWLARAATDAPAPLAVDTDDAPDGQNP